MMDCDSEGQTKKILILDQRVGTLEENHARHETEWTRHIEGIHASIDAIRQLLQNGAVKMTEHNEQIRHLDEYRRADEIRFSRIERNQLFAVCALAGMQFEFILGVVLYLISKGS